MAVFHYVSVDDQGHTHKGVLDGDSVQHIQQQLQDMHLIPLEIKKTERKTGGLFFKTKRIKTSTLTLITFQLGTLLTAGLTVEAALLNIAEQMETNNLKTILLGVRMRVIEGHTLAYGMDEYPDVFPSLYRATVSAGDKSGKLDNVINRLAVYLEQQEHIKQKVQQAMVYPGLLTLVSFGIIAFLLTYAMPKITTVFTESGQELPGITNFLLGLSGFLKSYGLYILIGIVGGFFLFKYKLRSEPFRYKFQLFLLKIPVIGNTMKIVNAARFARTFGILFAAGVPVFEAMQTANSVVNLLPMRKAIAQAITHVVEGVSINLALADTGYFSKLSTQLIASGESSGKLDLMLEKSASYQEKQVEKWITTALGLFEPVMILFMGGVVLFIVLAILLPIFQMNAFFG